MRVATLSSFNIPYKETIKANNKTIIIPKDTIAKANEYVLVSSPIELVTADVNESIFF